MPEDGKSKFLDEVRGKLRYKHYSLRTEQAYVGWIKRFILFHRKRHPREMGADEVTEFLSHLAVHGGVSAATQNQALCALLFLYKVVLGQDLPWLDNIERAKKPKRLPTVLTVDETSRLLDQIGGTLALMVRLQYGVACGYGMCALAGKGCVFRAPRSTDPRRQRRQGSRDHAAGNAGAATQGTSGSGSLTV